MYMSQELFLQLLQGHHASGLSVNTYIVSCNQHSILMNGFIWFGYNTRIVVPLYARWWSHRAFVLLSLMVHKCNYVFNRQIQILWTNILTSLQSADAKTRLPPLKWRCCNSGTSMYGAIRLVHADMCRMCTASIGRSYSIWWQKTWLSITRPAVSHVTRPEPDNWWAWV